MTAYARKWMWLSLALTLILGMGLGVMLDEVVHGDRLLASRRAGGGAHERHRGRNPGRFLEKLDRELRLTEAQKTELSLRLDANREKAKAFWDRAEKDYSALRAQFRAEIRALLTPEQQAQFDSMLARADEKSKQEHR